MNPKSLPRNYEHLTVWERIRLRVAAQSRGDDVEWHRLTNTAPRTHWSLPHHNTTERVLHTFALMYISEQLESIAQHSFAQMKLREGDITDPNLIGELAGMSGTNAFCFQMRMLGWKKFCRRMGVNPDHLVSGNHESVMLKFCEDKMVKFAPTAEEMTRWFRSKGLVPGTLKSEDSEFRSWRRLLGKACDDAPRFDRKGTMKHALSKQYWLLSAKERLRLVFAALERGEDAEVSRLVESSPRVHLSGPDHAHYAMSLIALSQVAFIELVEQTALLRDALDDACESDETKDHVEWPKHCDRVLRRGCLLRTKYLGWVRFCKRIGMSPEGRWRSYPGSLRLLAAIRATKGKAYTPLECMAALNRNLPPGKAPLTKPPLTSKGIARQFYDIYRSGVPS